MYVCLCRFARMIEIVGFCTVELFFCKYNDFYKMFLLPFFSFFFLCFFLII